MHWKDDKDDDIHLTRDEYSRSVNTIDYFEEKNPYGVTHSEYQNIYDTLLVELQQIYDLRPRTRNTKSNNAYPPKKPGPTKRTPETIVAPKATNTLPIHPKPQVTSQVTKAHLEAKELEKNVLVFNLEQELHKIKS